MSYPSKSGRWPNSGIYFQNWNNYYFSFGYLCNINHYYRYSRGNIFIQIESNELDGAYGKEGRILFYGQENWLSNNLQDFYNASSAGNGKITFRINCNEYIKSLIYDYNFTTCRRKGNVLLDILPPQNIENIKISTDIMIDNFNRGFSL